MLFTMMRLLSITILVSLMITTSISSYVTSPQLSGLTLSLTRVDNALVVNLSLGTPPVEVVLMMDTGSSLTWTLCQPCPSCLEQYYDSRTSKTYKALPCGDPICSDPHTNTYNCTDNRCVYRVGYGDTAESNTETTGIASTETFTFHGGTSASGVMFGCSKAFTLPNDGPISGIMGINRSPETSILFQLFPPQKRRFSYCFAPFTGGDDGQLGSTTTLMTLGNDVVPQKTPSLQTPFVNRVNHYHLYLLDISVGNRRLGLPAGTFNTSGTVGTVVIDSGTTHTTLHEKPYTEVIGAFDQQYSSLGLQKMKPGNVSFELCYWKPAGFNNFLTLTYHFQGADYVVDGKYTSLIDEKGGNFCVEVRLGTRVLLGAWHQQNMRLVYDVSKGMLAFGPEDCAADRS